MSHIALHDYYKSQVLKENKTKPHTITELSQYKYNISTIYNHNNIVLKYLNTLFIRIFCFNKFINRIKRMI
jgi:hypothetical protein